MIFEERQIERNNFSSRAIILFGLMGLGFVAILIQIFSLQISSYSEHQLAALNNKNYSVSVQSLRGEIYDRKGLIIVRNEPTFDLIAKPNMIVDVEFFLARLKPVMSISAEEQSRFIKLHKEKAFTNKELVLKRDLSEEEIARFSVRSFKFTNAFIAKRYRRMSDYPDIFSHVLGYTSRWNGEYESLPDIPRSHWRDAELIYANGFIHGKTGLEETYNDQLAGQHGERVFEVDARGRLVKSIEYTPAEKGLDLFTHLDIKAQHSAAQSLGNRKGAVVAIDLKSGGINVMYSSPSYSINKLANGLSIEEFKNLTTDPSKPFFNRAIQGRYPPASTIKPAIGMFGLNNQLINWTYQIDDPGYFTLPEDGRIYRGWKKGGHGKVNLEKALLVSSNTYFYSLAYRSDMNELAKHLASLGFGKKVCADCFDEDGIFLPTPNWKYNNLNIAWFKGDTVNIGIGQGYMLATPIQLANYASIIANKGLAITPSLTTTVSQELPKQSLSNNKFSQKNWTKLHKALTDVIESDYGTARKLRDLKTFQIAGKTGTAELVSLDSKEAYKTVRNMELKRDHAIIIVFGPMPNPQYAVSVIVENGESGGVVAGPIAIEVLKSLIND